MTSSPEDEMILNDERENSDLDEKNPENEEIDEDDDDDVIGKLVIDLSEEDPMTSRKSEKKAVTSSVEENDQKIKSFKKKKQKTLVSNVTSSTTTSSTTTSSSRHEHRKKFSRSKDDVDYNPGNYRSSNMKKMKRVNVTSSSTSWNKNEPVEAKKQKNDLETKIPVTSSTVATVTSADNMTSLTAPESRSDTKKKADESMTSSTVTSQQSISTMTCNMATMTSPEAMGPLEPGTVINLEGIVWHEAVPEGVLVLNITWRGRNYIGTLMDATKHEWAPPSQRHCDSEVDDVMRPKSGRSKRQRNGGDTSNLAANGGRKSGRSRNSAPDESIKSSPAKRRTQKALEVADMTSSTEESSARSSAKRARLAIANSMNCRTTPPSGEKNSGGSVSSPCSSPEMFDCNYGNCRKKFKCGRALEFHQSYKHEKEKLEEVNNARVATLTSQDTKNLMTSSSHADDDLFTKPEAQNLPAKSDVTAVMTSSEQTPKTEMKMTSQSETTMTSSTVEGSKVVGASIEVKKAEVEKAEVMTSSTSGSNVENESDLAVQHLLQSESHPSDLVPIALMTSSTSRHHDNESKSIEAVMTSSNDQRWMTSSTSVETSRKVVKGKTVPVPLDPNQLRHNYVTNDVTEKSKQQKKPNEDDDVINARIHHPIESFHQPMTSSFIRHHPKPSIQQQRHLMMTSSPSQKKVAVTVSGTFHPHPDPKKPQTAVSAQNQDRANRALSPSNKNNNNKLPSNAPVTSRVHNEGPQKARVIPMQGGMPHPSATSHPSSGDVTIKDRRSHDGLFKIQTQAENTIISSYKNKIKPTTTMMTSSSTTSQSPDCRIVEVDTSSKRIMTSSSPHVASSSTVMTSQQPRNDVIFNAPYSQLMYPFVSNPYQASFEMYQAAIAQHLQTQMHLDTNHRHHFDKILQDSNKHQFYHQQIDKMKTVTSSDASRSARMYQQQAMTSHKRVASPQNQHLTGRPPHRSPRPPSIKNDASRSMTSLEGSHKLSTPLSRDVISGEKKHESESPLTKTSANLQPASGGQFIHFPQNIFDPSRIAAPIPNRFQMAGVYPSNPHHQQATLSSPHVRSWAFLQGHPTPPIDKQSPIMKSRNDVTGRASPSRDVINEKPNYVPNKKPENPESSKHRNAMTSSRAALAASDHRNIPGNSPPMPRFISNPHHQIPKPVLPLSYNQQFNPLQQTYTYQGMMPGGSVIAPTADNLASAPYTTARAPYVPKRD